MKNVFITIQKIYIQILNLIQYHDSKNIVYLHQKKQLSHGK
jgi:hypothetical protein